MSALRQSADDEPMVRSLLRLRLACRTKPVRGELMAETMPSAIAWESDDGRLTIFGDGKWQAFDLRGSWTSGLLGIGDLRALEETACELIMQNSRALEDDRTEAH